VNWLDLVLLLVIGLSVVAGFAKGFARSSIGLASVVLGLLAGLWFYGAAGAVFLPYVSSRGIASFIGFFLIFLAFVIAGSLIAGLVGRFLKWAGLSWLDRVAGGAFGFVRGLVVSVALVLALMAFAVTPPPKAVVESRVAPYVVDAARILALIAPRELKDGVQASYERVKKIWSEALDKGVRRLPAEPI
jgi:membrane protein required for colicin V production